MAETGTTTGWQTMAGAAVSAIAARPLLVAAIGTIAIGIVARRGDLVRGGARLAAVQVAAAAIGGALRRGAEHGPANAPTPPPMVVDGMAMWLAEALVNRFDSAANGKNRLIALSASRASEV